VSESLTTTQSPPAVRCSLTVRSLRRRGAFAIIRLRGWPKRPLETLQRPSGQLLRSLRATSY